MSILGPLVGLTGLSWSIALALAIGTLAPAMLVWLAAAVYGPNTLTWEWAGFTVSIDRLVMGWFVLFLGARFLLGRNRPAVLARDGAVLAAVAFAALGLIQVTAIPWSPTAPEDMPPMFRLAYLVLCPLLLYAAIVSDTLKDPGRPHIERLLLVLWAFGVYLGWTAIAEQFGYGRLVLPKHILRPRELYLGRPVGPFLSTPLLGTTLSVSLAAAVLVARLRQGPVRVLVTATLPLIVAGIALTETRSVWLGSVGVVALLVSFLSGRHLRYGLLVLAVVAAAAGVVFLGAEFVNPSRREGTQLVEFSFLQRLALLDGALTLFLQRPVVGWGFGQFERVVRVHVGGGVLGFWATGAAEGLSSHNVLLRLLAETGLVGTGLWLTCWFVWLRAATRCLQAHTAEHRALGLLFLAAAVAYWSEAMFHDPSFLPAGNLMVGLLAGLVRQAADVIAPRSAAQRASREPKTNNLGLRQRALRPAPAG